ncbi:hypothetical protein [Clostridium sp. BNL1100]|uniref:hypothetical protein n=1 Tax=Clostridium sp. BNL1100 TaxID=755731 RepID=UPI00024A77E3|nr:hypothetical protein [Clostridium sp. BNL1100]AEY65640.1 hypothetical protein Clo1100_1405 [Clostridium sp. BNL1100]
MRKAKTFIRIGICIIILGIISTAAIYAMSQTNVNKENEKAESLDSLNISSKLDSSNYEKWKESLKKINDRNKVTTLTKEKLNELYDSGYSLNDIEKAEKLSISSHKAIEDILNLKYSHKGKTLVQTDKSWDDIESDLLGSTTKGNELKSINAEEETLKNKKLSKEQVSQINILSLNYGKDTNLIISDMESGKTYEELDKQYWEEHQAELKKVDTQKSQMEIESNAREKNNISDEDIKLAKKYGMQNIIEIGYAKSLTQKFNSSLKHVLELKSKEKKWSAVENILKEEAK